MAPLLLGKALAGIGLELDKLMRRPLRPLGVDRRGVLFDEQFRPVKAEGPFTRWQFIELTERHPHRLEHDDIGHDRADAATIGIIGQRCCASRKRNPPAHQRRPSHRIGIKPAALAFIIR